MARGLEARSVGGLGMRAARMPVVLWTLVRSTWADVRTRNETPDPDEMTRAEVDALIDHEARRYLNMSREEFEAALARHELPDSPAVTQLSLLAGARGR